MTERMELPKEGDERTRVERGSDLDLVTTRRFEAPVELVFKAWTKPALFTRWWVPPSVGIPIRSCEMDVRTGGSYRLEFGKDADDVFCFFGNYLEVDPPARLVWTNDEGENGPVTTVTFTPDGTGTLLVMHDRYPTKEALNEALVGMEGAAPAQFAQLDELLESLRSDAG